MFSILKEDFSGAPVSSRAAQGSADTTGWVWAWSDQPMCRVRTSGSGMTLTHLSSPLWRWLVAWGRALRPSLDGDREGDRIMTCCPFAAEKKKGHAIGRRTRVFGERAGSPRIYGLISSAGGGNPTQSIGRFSSLTPLPTVGAGYCSKLLFRQPVCVEGRTIPGILWHEPPGQRSGQNDPSGRCQHGRDTGPLRYMLPRAKAKDR